MNNHDRFFNETSLERDLRRERISARRALFLAVVIFSSIGGAVFWSFGPGF